MDIPWNGDGIWPFQMDSIWNPYGIKVEWNQENEWDPSQNIFHMEWMESTWNYMEYGGRVKTSTILRFQIFLDP